MNAFLKGTKDVSPFITGVAPFGLIYGVTAAQSDLSFLQSFTMSQIIFAGASQIALIEQLKSNSSFFIIVITVFMINLRMAMYSASIAPYYKEIPLYKKAIMAYFLVDQAYAVTISNILKDDQTDRFWYYMGTGVTMWFVWQISSLLGILVGATIPTYLSLEFAIPLTFIALLVGFLKEKRYIVTALVSGALMVVLKNLPFNTGFFIAVFVGVYVGKAYERWFYAADE
ncbi:MAG: AzlC family ABC transporter permease [Calditerrivibrio sp.]|nr:AzlC family ABC transporter permease [Calditerrivibrio sp.]